MGRHSLLRLHQVMICPYARPKAEDFLQVPHRTQPALAHSVLRPAENMRKVLIMGSAKVRDAFFSNFAEKP